MINAKIKFKLDFTKLLKLTCSVIINYKMNGTKDG